MVMNVSDVGFFTLTSYVDVGPLKFLVFVVFMVLYVVIVGCNVLLLLVICLNRTLHQPMYMFLCSLFVNELYGSSGLFPFLLLQILSDVHTVPAPLCFLQIFCLYMYGNVEFYTLAVMSYDRYQAICSPLRYNTHMSCSSVVRLVVFSWLLPLVNMVIMMSLSASSQLCGNRIDRLFCNNYSIVKLACGNTTASNVYGLVYTFCVLLSLALLILYSYIRILTVCLSGSKRTRHKAVRTCTPHLLSLLNFSFGCFFEVLQGRLDLSGAPNLLRILLSVYFVTVQPLLSPVLYGLSLREVQLRCRTLFFAQR